MAIAPVGLPTFAFMAILSFSPFSGCNEHNAISPTAGPKDNGGPTDTNGPNLPSPGGDLGGGYNNNNGNSGNNGNHNPPPPPPPSGGNNEIGNSNNKHGGDKHGGGDGHEGNWENGGDGPHGGTPEPATMLLVTGSAAGYAALRRRRKLQVETSDSDRG